MVNNNNKNKNNNYINNNGDCSDLLNNKLVSNKLCSNDIEYMDQGQNNLSKYEQFSKILYSEIEDLIETKGINNNTEVEIEKLVIEQFKVLNDYKVDTTILGVKTNSFTSKFNEFCQASAETISKYLVKRSYYLNSEEKLRLINKSSLVKSRDIEEFIFKDILNVVKYEYIINMMLFKLFTILTYENKYIDGKDEEGLDIFDDEENKKIITSLTEISVSLGKKIFNIYIKTLYNEHKKSNGHEKNSFSNFKENILKDEIYSSLLERDEVRDDLYTYIGSQLIEIMEYCDMIKRVVLKLKYKDKRTILKVSDSVSVSLEKNIVYTLPLKLPMIVKPKLYTKYELGGYLLNDIEFVENIIRDKKGLKEKSKILDENIVYFTINNMSATPFKVNKDLLDYLIIYNNKHNLLINIKEKHKYQNIKRNAVQEKEYQSYLSKKILQQNILNVAQAYRNVPEIYFPVSMDFRGRINVVAHYFNYQSSELAKALLLFANPGVIRRNDTQAIESLKVYGANCYGNSLNRKSFNKRIEWVDNNIEDIINYDNGILLNKADDKLLFMGFCIEYARFNAFLSQDVVHEFKTYLCIQLDATCNGYQHLALLSNELRLYNMVNLSKSKKNLDPNDLYTYLRDKLIVLFEKRKHLKLDNGSSYERLSKVRLTRSNLKASIMIGSYNASHQTKVSAIINSLTPMATEKIKVLDSNNESKEKEITWYKADEDNNLINEMDISLIVTCLNKIIYVEFAKVKELMIYLRKWVSLHNKEGLPIVWRTPNGLEVNQRYQVINRRKVKPFSSKNTSITLSSIKDIYAIDNNKQSRALMPNFVHSLDAACLSLLYYLFYKETEEDNVVNFYSVHDCFAVTADNVNKLRGLFKNVMIDMYANTTHMQKFDRDIISYFISALGEENCEYIKRNNKRYFIINNKKVRIPDLSFIGNVEFNRQYTKENISESFYAIY